MHLTRQSDYGVRALLHLASLPYGAVVQTKEIAAREDIPAKYLPTIIRTLARAGLIRTLRGNQGGVLLARPPEDINLREAIEAVEGPIALVPCLQGPQQCSRQDNCGLQPVCANLQQSIVGQLENITFADMMDSYPAAKTVPINEILDAGEALGGSHPSTDNGPAEVF